MTAKQYATTYRSIQITIEVTKINPPLRAWGNKHFVQGELGVNAQAQSQDLQTATVLDLCKLWLTTGHFEPHKGAALIKDRRSKGFGK